MSNNDGFEVIETITKQNKPPMAVVSYLKSQRKLKGDKRDDRKPRLLIYIPSKLMTAQSKNFLLMMGKGVQRKLRVVGQNAANKNTVPCTSMKHCIRFDFGFVPYLGNEMAAGEECALTVISRESYEIDMPKWFKPERK